MRKRTSHCRAGLGTRTANSCWSDICPILCARWSPQGTCQATQCSSIGDIASLGRRCALGVWLMGRVQICLHSSENSLLDILAAFFNLSRLVPVSLVHSLWSWPSSLVSRRIKPVRWPDAPSKAYYAAVSSQVPLLWDCASARNRSLGMEPAYW